MRRRPLREATLADASMLEGAGVRPVVECGPNSNGGVDGDVDLLFLLDLFFELFFAAAAPPAARNQP